MKQPEILSRFCSEFTGLLDHNLPGAEAHERLAPSNRSELLKLGKNGPAPQLSGVLILMYARREQINLVFIQRSIYKGIHSGQVSFPGGKADPQDRDLAQTALRETFEEVGVHPDSIDFIGRISDLYVPPSNFIIRPFVGMYKGEPRFVPDPVEVAEVFSVPLSFLLNYKDEINHPVVLSNGSSMLVPGFKFGPHLIWGATAMILSEFLTLAFHCPSVKLISAYD